MNQMSYDQASLQELLIRWEEGELTPAETEALILILKSNKSARRILVFHFMMNVGIAKTLKAGRGVKNIATTPVARRPIIFVRRLALAATLAIVAGGVWFGLQSVGVSEPLGLRVTEATGEAQVVRVQGSGFRGRGRTTNSQQPTANIQHPNGEGTAVKAVVGMEIRQGERVVVKDGGKVGLKYDGEATTIELLAATEASFGAEKGAKMVTLAAGKMICAAAPQKLPFRIQTPQAVAEVVGTRFSLDVDSALTTLAVQEGKVALIQDEKRLQVNAGESATASDAGLAMAQTLAGQIWTWTWQMNGEKSEGNVTPPVPLNTLDGKPFSDVTAVAVGGDRTVGVALKADGSVWTCGMAAGNNKATDLPNSVPVKLADGTPFADVTAIAAGKSHTVALRKDRTVWAWGANINGELGDGTASPQVYPVQVRGLSDVTAIAANHSYTLALRADGTVWILGGKMDTTVQSAAASEGLRKSAPVQVRQRDGKILSEVIAVSAGYNHAVALKKDGTVWTCGDNSYGELGDGTPTIGIGAVQARLADGSALRDVVAISAGHVHTVALKSDHSVWAWGRLGDAGAMGRQSTPVQVVAADGAILENITAITAGYLPHRFLAVSRDGTCWGWTGEQLSLSDNGKQTLRVRVTRIKELTNVISVVGGSGYTMALAK